MNVKKVHHAVALKPNTLIFNLVLDACVRFKLSLKGLCLIELMSLTGTVADAHSIVIISQILEMNGLRDEMMELKYHIDGVSTAHVCHYRQFYDSLLSLHFKYNDIDAAAKLVSDMNSSQNCHHHNKENRNPKQKPCFIAIGSPNLKKALRVHIEPEQLQKDFVLRVESREGVLFFIEVGNLFLVIELWLSSRVVTTKTARLVNFQNYYLSFKRNYTQWKDPVCVLLWLVLALPFRWDGLSLLMTLRMM